MREIKNNSVIIYMIGLFEMLNAIIYLIYLGKINTKYPNKGKISKNKTERYLDIFFKSKNLSVCFLFRIFVYIVKCVLTGLNNKIGK